MSTETQVASPPTVRRQQALNQVNVRPAYLPGLGYAANENEFRNPKQRNLNERNRRILVKGDASPVYGTWLAQGAQPTHTCTCRDISWKLSQMSPGAEEILLNYI